MFIYKNTRWAAYIAHVGRGDNINICTHENTTSITVLGEVKRIHMVYYGCGSKCRPLKI
jgi:hypothetical protein